MPSGGEGSLHHMETPTPSKSIIAIGFFKKATLVHLLPICMLVFLGRLHKNISATGESVP